MKFFRCLQEVVLEIHSTANAFPIGAFSIEKISCNNSACPFSQTARRTARALQFVHLVSVGTVRRSFQLFPGEINEDSAIDSNAAAILVTVSAPSLKGLREVIKKQNQTAP